MRTIEWMDNAVLTVDQTKLPRRLIYIKLKSCRDVALAIKTMKIRGAPLIGAAAAYGLALTASHSRASTKKELLKQIQDSVRLLKQTRPTGVNLFWAVDRIMKKIREEAESSVNAMKDLIVTEAQRVADEDVEINRKIGEHGSRLIADHESILTHCNAGALATVDYGTALGVIRAAWDQGKKIGVIATETRPRLQGARLTSYELKTMGIPFVLITDNMVGYVMSKGLVNRVITGADRIAKDAVINKIGTYSIAVLAREHHIPFHAAAPLSTFDLSHATKNVTIEERSSEEITRIGSKIIAPAGTKTLNPAFDVTPMKYVTSVICEKGVFTPKQLKQLI